MLKEAIQHLTDSNYAFALDEKTIVFRIRTKKDDIQRCTLFYGDRVCEQNPITTEKILMEKVSSDQLFSYYECTVFSEYTRICYYFLLEDEDEKLYYFGDEFHLTSEYDRTEYYQFAYNRREDIVRMPDWVASSIIYQIFPDSFATQKRYIRKEGAELQTAQGEYCVSRNGGTLRGIQENLDYISELGVNCIYLNPIFLASSYHKYDTIDYFSIDPCFGTKEELKELVSACHREGIRVVLDGVFNHCGWRFFAFQDVLQNGRDSRYADWFYRMEFPVQFEAQPNYEAFAYVREMPKLNTGNPEVARYLCSIGTYWIQEADIDGWRLDVANEVNHDFWRQFRREVKGVKPDALLIGEIWEDAQQWLQGDQFDSTMNYRFSNLCRDFFAQRSLSSKEFDEKLHAMIMHYKKPISFAQMNLLDSHDVPRFLSKCDGDLRKLKLAVFFQMTFVGIPSIFYGDEAAIQGKNELEYRSPMPWQDCPDQGELFQYIKKLILLRKTHPALTHGDFLTGETADAGVYVFIRRTDTEKLLIALNNSDVERTVHVAPELTQSVFYSIFPQEEESASTKEIKLPSMSGKIVVLQGN